RKPRTRREGCHRAAAFEERCQHTAAGAFTVVCRDVLPPARCFTRTISLGSHHLASVSRVEFKRSPRRGEAFQLRKKFRPCVVRLVFSFLTTLRQPRRFGCVVPIELVQKEIGQCVPN